MNIDNLIEKDKPLHPIELEQNGLKFNCFYADLIMYKDKQNNLYGFKNNELKPFLNYYYTWKEIKWKK